MPSDELTSLIASKKNLLKPASRSRVGLRLEQWLLETFSAAQEVATKEGDIAADYLSALLKRQLDEVEDAELLVSKVLFNSWQDKKYWLESIRDEANELQTLSETSGKYFN